jgi:hypothetical protein
VVAIYGLAVLILFGLVPIFGWGAVALPPLMAGLLMAAVRPRRRAAQAGLVCGWLLIILTPATLSLSNAIDQLEWEIARATTGYFRDYTPVQIAAVIDVARQREVAAVALYLLVTLGTLAVASIPVIEHLIDALPSARLCGPLPLAFFRGGQALQLRRWRMEAVDEKRYGEADCSKSWLVACRGTLLLAVICALLAPPHATRAGGVAQACFAETGQCIQGRFLDYWQGNGGLAQFGYPLTGEQPELLEDGKTYTVQYFERARFELHPENAAPNDVLLGQFGRRVLAGRFGGDVAAYRRAIAPVPASGQGRYFPETGHNVGGRFLAYWEANGGLARFGLPLAEEAAERLFAGNTYTVQYFERARLEYHPENAGTPYEVLLGQFGRQILAENAQLAGDFRALYIADESVRLRLGAPITTVITAPGALQTFERGRMYYNSLQFDRLFRGPIITVLCGPPERGRLILHPDFGYFPDLWSEGQEPGGGPAPTPGLYFPQRGFGKIWRENPTVPQFLGYATTATETVFTPDIQFFAGGALLRSETAEGHFIYVLHVQGHCNGCPNEGDYERFPATPR